MTFSPAAAKKTPPLGTRPQRAALSVLLLVLIAACGHEDEKPPPVEAPEGGARIARVLGEGERLFELLGEKCWAFEWSGAPVTYHFQVFAAAPEGPERLLWEARGDEISTWALSQATQGAPPEGLGGYLIAVVPHVPLSHNSPAELRAVLAGGAFRALDRRAAREALPPEFLLPADAAEDAARQYRITVGGKTAVAEGLAAGETVQLVDYRIQIIAPESGAVHTLHYVLTATCLEDNEIPADREPRPPAAAAAEHS